MRAKPSDEAEALDPLPVYDDGMAFEPHPAHASALPPMPSARECVEAVRDVLQERAAVRAQSPWTAMPVTPAVPPSTKFRSTFTRMIGLHPAQLADLPNWWRHRARGAYVRVARNLFLEEPHYSASGTWHVRGRLRSRWLRRSIPIELDLWPHLDAWTKLSLEPQRRVHAGRRYFRKGHRDLDTLTNRLIGELDRVAS